MTCDQRRDLLLLYVSGGLDPADAAEMRQHLQSGCPACAGYLAEAEALMASLPLALDPVAPPPEMKAWLMERIDAAESAKVEKPAPLVDQQRSDSLPMWVLRYLAPAAVAAGLAIIATHFVMNQRVTSLQQQASVLRRDYDAQTVLTSSLAQQLELLGKTSKAQTQVVDLLRSPDLKVYALKPQPNQPHAVANLLWDKKQGQWAILTDGMIPAPPGQTYELWFITKAGTPVAAGTFNVDAAGRGSIRVDIPAGIGAIAQAAVTNESGFLPSPKGSAQLAGPVE